MFPASVQGPWDRSHRRLGTTGTVLSTRVRKSRRSGGNHRASVRGCLASNAVTPEASIVTALARGDGPRLSTAARGAFDPARVISLAACHQVDALGGWMWRKHLHEACGPAGRRLDGTLGRRLWESYLHHTVRNEALIADIANVEDSLASQQIETIYFKGPWLLAHAYPDPGTRPV